MRAHLPGFCAALHVVQRRQLRCFREGGGRLRCLPPVTASGDKHIVMSCFSHAWCQATEGVVTESPAINSERRTCNQMTCYTERILTGGAPKLTSSPLLRTGGKESEREGIMPDAVAHASSRMTTVSSFTAFVNRCAQPSTSSTSPALDT